MFSFQLGSYATICCVGVLTHWGQVTHICVSKLTIIGSDNDLSPGRRQAIIWTNAGILLIRTLGTNFSEIPSEIHTYSFKKIHLKMSSGKRRPFCLGLNVLINVKHWWGLVHQRQTSRPWINENVQEYYVGYNFLSMTFYIKMIQRPSF